MGTTEIAAREKEAPEKMEEDPPDSSAVTPTESGKRAREETMEEEGVEESSGNLDATQRTGLSSKLRTTDLNKRDQWVHANDSTLEYPAKLAQFIQDIRKDKEQQLGLTYGDIHGAAGETAEHGVIGSDRVAWNPSIKIGAPGNGGTLRQLNGVHQNLSLIHISEPTRPEPI
eukprot:8266076-Pyramimonas_sp.AAC.1